VTAYLLSWVADFIWSVLMTLGLGLLPTSGVQLLKTVPAGMVWFSYVFRGDDPTFFGVLFNTTGGCLFLVLLFFIGTFEKDICGGKLIDPRKLLTEFRDVLEEGFPGGIWWYIGVQLGVYWEYVKVGVRDAYLRF
jgi:hypothetical protein